MKRSSVILATAFAVVALVISGVIGYAIHGTKSSSSTTANSSVSDLAAKVSATAHNDQDVMFAQMMVPHHEQAVEMAKDAATKASSQQVKDLAAAIEAAQGPEISAMNGWLQDWNASSSSSMSGMSGMDHGSMNHGGSSSGMMSHADMDKLATLSGSDFDKEFLTMMIEHHKGAITMAQTELRQGQYGDAVGMASSIVMTQQAQIAQMQDMLKSL